jgi:hypothetical protein
MSNDYSHDSFSLDSTVVVIDEPGDKTVRPCRPHLRPYLEAIKRKLEQYGEPRDDGHNDH